MSGPHVRARLDWQRVQHILLLALLPCVLMAMWNTGRQANLALRESGVTTASQWRASVLEWVGTDPDSMWAIIPA